jgi:hypothetical protein
MNFRKPKNEIVFVKPSLAPSMRKLWKLTPLFASLSVGQIKFFTAVTVIIFSFFHLTLPSLPVRVAAVLPPEDEHRASSRNAVF